MTLSILLFLENMIQVDKDLCDYCSACISVCPPDCIEVTENDLTIEHYLCIDCDLCVKICPIEALSVK